MVLPSANSDLRVVVVAEDLLARAGLATLLSAEPGCEVVGQVNGVDYLAAGPASFRADVAAWDFGWDASLWLEELADAEDTGPPVVALVPDATHAGQVRLAGARGILMRDADLTMLTAALRAAASGLVAIQPGLDTAPQSDAVDGAPPTPGGLSDREMEVLGLLAEGLPNKAIAARLQISEHTVKFHVTAILTKLGAQSRTEAVTRATRMGLLLL